MNAWSSSPNYIVFGVCIYFQVMCVSSLPKLIVVTSSNSLRLDAQNTSSNHNLTNAINPSDLAKYGGYPSCPLPCGSVQWVTGVETDKRTKSSRTERSVKGRVPETISGQGTESMRVFKYVHYDQFNPNSATSERSGRISGDTTTTTPPTTTVDRSLIPNSFFSPGVNQDKIISRTIPSNKSSSQGNLQRKTSGNDANSSAGVSERPRRSPYRPPSRSALHRLPPRPIQPPLAPLPMSVPLPYTQHVPTIDFGGYPYSSMNYGSVITSPQEEQSILYPKFKKQSQPPSSRRRLPPPPSHRRRPPPPRHRPLPRPRPGPGSGRGRPPRTSKPPQYSYPKDAANIQDILNYFNENDNQLGSNDPYMKPPSQPDLSGVSVGGGSDFSKELHDVQTSLLKDIREFAKRPSLLGTGDSSSHSKPESSGSLGNSASHHHTKKHNYRPESDYTEDFSYDEKPKPVRELIHHNRNQKSRERESDEINSDSNSHYGKGRPRSKYQDSRGAERNHHRDDLSKERYQGYYSNREKESEEQRHQTPYRDQESEERERFNRREKERNRNRQKHAGSSSRINYKDLDENRNSHEERYRDQERNPSHSTVYRRPSTHPVVLKRPYGQYKFEELDSGEFSRKRPSPSYNDYGEYDRPYVKDPYASVPRVRPPSITYRPKKESYVPDNESSRRRPNSSPEYIEDVVEIHTEPPYRVDLKSREEKEKRAKLHKLYLEYLEKKLEAEALTSTIQPVKKQPMRMKIHIYPNEGSQTEQTKATSHYVTPPVSPVSGYSHLQPIVSAPSRDLHQMYQNIPYQHHHIQQVHPSQLPPPLGNTGPQMMVDKNKNVVLHLHVHRRNGFGEMGSASEVYTSTVKPLTYKEIFDEHQQQKMQQNYPDGETEPHDNKSVSMELPIRDDKIEDVLHTLLQLRQ